MPSLPSPSLLLGGERRGRAVEPRRGSIRLKLFGIISLVVAVPVVALVVYFPASQMAQSRRDLVIKARSFASVIVQELGGHAGGLVRDKRPGVDPQQVLGGVLVDPDVIGLELVGRDGKVLGRVGELSGEGATVPHEVALTSVATAETEDRLIVHVPVALTPEGPVDARLRVDLSRARLVAEGASVRATAFVVGLLAVGVGCFLAWLVGAALGRRIEAIRAHAQRVAAGDLSPGPPVDRGRDELGEMARALRSMVQVVERQVADRTSALNATNEQLKMLLETTATVPWQIEIGTWRFLYVGPQVQTLLGIAPERWGRQDFWDTYVHPSDRPRVQGELERAVVEDRATDVEMRLVLPETSEERWVRLLVGASPTHSGSGQATSNHGAQADASLEIRGFLIDVTRQRLLELELRHAQKLESVGRLSNGIAHELNTPIQFVSDSLHFVREAVTDLGPLVARYLELKPALAEAGLGRWVGELTELEHQVDADYAVREIPRALARSLDGLQRVTRIVQSMRTFASADLGEKVPVDLNAALDATLQIANHEINHIADVETSFEALPRVECHAAEMNQVFLGIVLNACEAMAPKVTASGVRGRLRVASRVVEAQKGLSSDGEVEIAVSDTGPGIPEAIRGRIFDPFFSTKEVGQGTGQGLSMARNIVVTRHGGSLRFETGAMGTTFYVRLPVSPRAPV